MSEKVRAKFQCVAVTNYQGDRKKVELSVRYDTSIEEDKRFTKYMPSGDIVISIENASINDFYVPGKSYYLDFTPIEDEQAA